MKDSDSTRVPIGLWAMIALALILSATSIVLHITQVTSRNSRLDYSLNEYQQLIALNQRLRTDLSQLQDAINNSTNFNQLKKSMIQADQKVESPALSGKADSPFVALMVLEQSQRNGNFEAYQAIHPQAQQKVLEEVINVNRELSRAYEELTGSLSTRFGEIPDALEEPEIERLRRLIFNIVKHYEVVETKTTGDDKAEMKVKIDEYPVGSLTGAKLRTVECTLHALQEGTDWKIADHPDAIKRRQQVLTWLKQRVKDIKALDQRCRKNEFKQYADFSKVWTALPKEE